MQLTTIASAVLALLVLTGAAAALPGHAPAQADGNAANQTDGADDAADDHDEAPADENRTDGRDRGAEAAQGQRGPPADLPDAVPDFVGSVHDAIRDHVAGDGDGSLGDRISELTPGDDDESDDRADGATNASAA